MMTRTDLIEPVAPRTGSVAQTIGWCLGALIVAIAMGFAVNILVYDVLDAAIDPFTGGAVVPDPVTAVLMALLVGGSAGAVVGSRVTRGPIVASLVVLLLYLFVWPMSFMGIHDGSWLAVAVVAHFGFAALGAHLMSRRRSGPASQDSDV